MNVTRAGMMAMAMAGAVMGAAGARAQSADDDALAACASIASRSARLSCYDNAARRHVPPPAPRTANAPSPPRTRSRGPVAQGLGAEQVRDRRPKAERPVEVTRTTAKVISATDNGIGHWRIAVEGGAVWEMTLADPYFLPPRVGQEVRIRRGSLGGYLMDVGKQASVLVTRVR